jgi:20S proteasome alpha/beta subunit
VQAYLLGDTRMDQQKTQFLKKHLGIGDKTWMKYVGYVPDAAKLAADVKDAALEMHAYLKAQQLTMG